MNVIWSMVNNETLSAEGGAIEWLRTANPTVLGACHDNINTVYPLIAPTELVGERVSIEIDNTLEDEAQAFADALTATAQFLTADTGKILELERGLLIRLFNTPQYRIWCATYLESPEQFEADYLTVFGSPSSGKTMLEARAMIKGYYS